MLPEHVVKKQVDDIEIKLTFAKMHLTDIHAEELDVNALLAFGYEFIKLFLSDGLNSEFTYQFGIINIWQEADLLNTTQNTVT